MNLEIIALSLDAIGTLMIAFAAIMVHHRVLNEHKIDMEVESIMRKEQLMAKLGVVFVIAGYLMELSVMI